MIRSFRAAGFALLALSAMLFGLAFSAVTSYAHPAAQAASAVITIPAAQSATIRLRGFCIDPGKPFPDGITAPAALGNDNVRAGLYYAAQKGYTDSNPRQVQQAVWYLQTGTWQNSDHVLAQEIVDAAANTANKPVDPSGAVSLVDAISSKAVTAEITFTPSPDIAPAQAFYGDGDLKITNTGTAEIKVFMPFGVVFPPANAAQQRLVGYEIAVAQAPTLTPVPATSTPAPTNTVAPTITTAPTNTAAPAATNTVAAAPTMAAAPTSTATLPTLPTTGSGPGSSWLLLLFTGMMSLLAGLVMLRRSAVRS